MSTPGLPAEPYRKPCWLAAWPSERVLTLCAQHAHDSERRVPAKCNDAEGETTPTFETECASGTPVNGNCYSTCVEGDATGLLTDTAGYAKGSTDIVLSAGTGTVKAGDYVQFSGDGNNYQVLYELSTPPLAGQSLLLASGLLVAIPPAATAVTIQPGGFKDFSVCVKRGKKAVRARKWWHGKKGWESGCGACDDSTTRYTTRSAEVVHHHVDGGGGNEWTATYTRTVAVDPATGLFEEPEGGCSDTIDPEDYSGPSNIGPDLFSKILMVGEWCNGPQFREDYPGDLEGFGAQMNYMFARALAGTGTSCNDCSTVTAGEDCYEIENSGIVTKTCVSLLSHSDTVISGTVEITVSSDPDYVDSYAFTWTLADEYTLEQCVADAYGLAQKWRLDDDVQYPWRNQPYKLRTNPVWGVDEHMPIPFLIYRENAVSELSIPLTCGTVPVCGGFTIPPGKTCPYDGAILGDPLPNGSGTHYAFWDGNGLLADKGWNPGYGLPATATWWTSEQSESTVSDWPAGGWVVVDGEAGYVMVQVWAEVKETHFAQGTYPCEGDGRAAWGAAYKPICWRLAIASMSLDTGTHYLTVVLSEPAYYLQAGDRIDFAKYAGSAETLDTGSFKQTPDTAGYEVFQVDSPTQFLLNFIAAVPETYTHVKSHGTPDFFDYTTYLGSVNFFRPCGEDDRGTWGSDYKAICGRLAISSLDLDAGTLTVTLAEPADYLQAGDLLDFTKYGAAPAYAETADAGASKSVPDTDGYEVDAVADSTHFTVVGIASLPSTYTHVKSHAAPHFKWHDGLRKGDFAWCLQETSCGTPATPTCEAGCLPLSTCFPAVAAVLVPDYLEDFPNADVQTLPAAADVANSYRYHVKPRIYEDDPFYTGADPAPQVESMCEPPDGAPDFPAGVHFAGCATLPAGRPAPTPAPARGLGDAVALIAQPVARLIDAATRKLPPKLRTNVAGCGGCKKRQERLNRAFPFKKSSSDPLQK